jgi:hypothetical protein
MIVYAEFAAYNSRDSKEIAVSNVERDQPSSVQSDLRAELLRAGPTNPALQRLQQRVLEGADASEVITSYDRMHHRHSRS